MGKDDAILNAFKEDQTVEKISADRKLRVGIIGCGWIADAHIKAYLAQPDVEIVAGADLIPGKAAAFFKKHGIERVKTDYASHKEMLDDK
ncbi:MAG TPA: Gfo/Idh/MocA family oxidoreductase, partial [Bacillota bacterium]|nr:Gfo/Idh/MocA family oxidoreductase [Bacillota bacterium]